jgi:hypothetical protein
LKVLLYKPTKLMMSLAITFLLTNPLVVVLAKGGITFL